VTSPMTSDPSRPVSTALPRRDITSSRLHMRRQIDPARARTRWQCACSIYYYRNNSKLGIITNNGNTLFYRVLVTYVTFTNPQPNPNPLRQEHIKIKIKLTCSTHRGTDPDHLQTPCKHNTHHHHHHVSVLLEVRCVFDSTHPEPQW